MAVDLNQAMVGCLRRLVRPVIRFCLKRTLSIQSLIESVKIEYVAMAADEMKAQNQKVNVSRISAATGIRRKEVDRILAGNVEIEGYFGFGPRVIAQWRRDRRFLTKSKQPRMLTYLGTESEFTKLVHCVSTDIHPKAVLTDLERLGLIVITENGLKLHAKAYRPAPDTVESFSMLAADVDDLVGAVLDNFASEEKILPNYHARTFFDNVDKKDVPAIRKWLFVQCSKFQLKAELYLAGFDRDVNRAKKRDQGGGTKISLGIFTKT